MGRLTLNILLVLRPVRARGDGRAHPRQGRAPAGGRACGWEDVRRSATRSKDRKLVINETDAAHVRWIFARFLEIGSGTELARELAKRGVRTSRGNRIDKKYLYRLLNNRALIGEAVHKGDQLSRRA